MERHRVQALLMGGQACVFYGAAQFSKDVDLILLADDANFARLHQALAELQAERIAVPRFDPALLEHGHAVHFRCHATGVEGLRVDVMTRLRGVDEFPLLWNRRTTLSDDEGGTYEILALEDLVQAKKTQRDKDWPMIGALVEAHYRAEGNQPTPERVAFWLMEARSADRLIELCRRFPDETRALLPRRPLLNHGRTGDADSLRAELDAETRLEQAKDRAFWEPLRRELEALRREERHGGQGS